MKSSARSAKWFSGLTADMPVVRAARLVLDARLKAVERALPLAVQHSSPNGECVHELRVTTRRAGAAMASFRSVCPERLAKKIRRSLRALRRAASAARADDVHAVILRAERERVPAEFQAAFEYALDAIRECRAGALRRLRKAAREFPPARLRRARRKLKRALDAFDVERTQDDGPREPQRGSRCCAEDVPAVLSETVCERLLRLVEDMLAAGRADLGVLENAHILRLAAKKLRYAMEIFASCFPRAFRSQLVPQVEALQEQLGAINDVHELQLRIEKMAASDRGPKRGQRPLENADREGLDRLADRLRRERDRRHREFVDDWTSGALREALDRILQFVQRLQPPPPCANTITATAPSTPPRPKPKANGKPPKPPAADQPMRVAAIDVGTNSIRLVVAEADPAAPFRIIEDVKETTRLGNGLYRSDLLTLDAIKASIRALTRMKNIATEHHAQRIRAIATSAVREARNGPQFGELVRRRLGIDLEIIDADTEGRLAFASVARSFDLSQSRVAIVDIGGGSTELVLADHGALYKLHKLPLGAVRLTEMYAERQDPTRCRYDELCRDVSRTVDETVRDLEWRPEFIIGCGGTFTNLGRISLRRASSITQSETSPRGLRGHELTREEIAGLLDWIKSMTLAERRNVPGLSERRAEIIVAGFCIVDRLTHHLGVDRVRIHDGGIRDGLLAQMFGEPEHTQAPQEV